MLWPEFDSLSNVKYWLMSSQLTLATTCTRWCINVNSDVPLPTTKALVTGNGQQLTTRLLQPLTTLLICPDTMTAQVHLWSASVVVCTEIDRCPTVISSPALRLYLYIDCMYMQHTIIFLFYRPVISSHHSSSRKYSFYFHQVRSFSCGYQTPKYEIVVRYSYKWQVESNPYLTFISLSCSSIQCYILYTIDVHQPNNRRYVACCAFLPCSKDYRDHNSYIGCKPRSFQVHVLVIHTQYTHISLHCGTMLDK